MRRIVRTVPGMNLIKLGTEKEERREKAKEIFLTLVLKRESLERGRVRIAYFCERGYVSFYSVAQCMSVLVDFHANEYAAYPIMLLERSW